MGAAFRSLPHAEITADSSDAEIKVNTLRASLRELANKRIGVDVNSDAALGEMRAIKAELEGLQQTGDISVRADVTRALAALNSVEREVDKLDRKSVDVDVDVDGAGAAVAQVGLLERGLISLSDVGPAKLALVAGAISLLPTIGAAAAGGIVTVLGGALAGLGLAASKGSAAAQDAIARLKQAAVAEAARMGQPFEKVWVTIADEAERQLGKLGPIVRRNLDQLAPETQNFVRQAGDSLGELEPALDGIARAFSAVLADLGPAMPEIMGHLASAITSVTDAVQENPEAITDLVTDLAILAEWTGKLIGGLTRLKAIIDDNKAAFHVLTNTIAPGSTALFAMVDGFLATQHAADKSTTATQRATQVYDTAGQRLAALAQAYGLAGDNSAEAAQKMLDSWSSAYSSFVDMGGALETIRTQTRAGVSGTDRQAQASERLAEVQRQAAEKIQRAERDLADASERATERVKDAKRKLADAHERAAEQVARAQERVRDAQQGVADAVESASRREADAAERVGDAQRRAAEVAEDSGRKIADAQQRVSEAAEDGGRRVADAERRVADAQTDAAERVVDAERRLQDSHARTADAVEDLTRARERAQERLEDLQRQESGSALDEEGALLGVERARQRMVELNVPESKATDLERREADLAYRQALKRLDDVRQRNNDLREELDKAQRAGVEGSDEVLQAKKRVADAQKAEQEAEAAIARAREDGAKAVAAAEQALADARMDAARQVAQAEQALSDARAAAARQQEDAARQLASAEADANRARIDSAKEVQKAKADVAKAEADAAKAAQDATRTVKDAETDLAKTKRDSARDIKDAERELADARRDAARDVQKANADVAQSWTSLGGTVKVTTKEYLAELDRQVRAQEEWAGNLVKLAGRVPPEMLGELAKMGPKGAEIVAMMTRMTEPELAHFVELHGRSGKLAGDKFADSLKDAGRVLEAIAEQRGEGVANKVRQGMERGAVSVYDAAKKIGLRITEEVGPEHKIKITADAAPAYGVLNKLLSDIGLSSAQVPVGIAKNADGNIYMANGGVLSFASGTERHVAQIAGPGTRIWAEPETAGEAYIPLAASKRARSEEILARVADMFGGAYVRSMPAGGMPVYGGDGASAGGGATYITVNATFADDRNLYEKGAELAAGLREYVRRGGVMPG